MKFDQERIKLQGSQQKKESNTILTIQDLHAGYGSREILHGLSISFSRGSITVLAGPNGCGKSTLLKTLTGLVSKSGGAIWINGTPIEQLSAVERARQVAYLPQQKRIPEMTVLTMALHGRFAHLSYPRRYRQKDIEAAREAIRLVGLAGQEERMLSELSGGTQQRVFLAMALAQDAPVILLDEPTSFLDISYQLQLMDLCRSLADSGKAVVMVLHDLPAALKYADKLAVLSEGRLAAAGTPVEVYESGVLDRVFGVKVKQVMDGEERVYYCL